MLIQLTYASRSSSDITPEQVRDIAEISQKNNVKTGITGALVFSDGIFLQKLEGERQTVNQLYEKILKDERHEETVILDYAEILSRDFTEWSMGFLTQIEDNRQLFQKYSATNQFNPYQMNSATLRAFFAEIRQNVRWLKR